MNDGLIKYIEFKTKQFARTNGIDLSTIEKNELALLIKPMIKQWVGEAICAGV